jgi:phospholipid/cholesterol/gamma-HCH transport system permease protein
LPDKSLDVIGFIGEIAVSFSRLLRGKAICGAREIWVCVQEAGAGALPIVALVSLLVGLILAYVGVVQLRLLGTEIYVASLVVIGMTRIMGAVMTGIVLAGRTGASYAAIIGSMQVNEEVDALVSLGVPPSDYLVLPRIIALGAMTPLLVLYADFMGIFGGFIVGSLVLGIDPVEYLNYTRQSLKYAHIFVGVTHGFAFGLVVAAAGCYQGLRCRRSAAGVGAAATAAVVNAIVFIILVTAVLTMLFNAVRL